MTTAPELSRDVIAPDKFATKSSRFREVLEQAHRMARSGMAPILLEGESGTGKTLLAHYLHSVSPRSSRPFHSVVLSTLDDSLASSDLFGHVSGAFTDARRARTGHFVASQGSTLLLDEIGKASRTLQGKLLHAIEYNEVTPVGSDKAVRVDVRVIAATNVSLEELVNRDQFLPDLAARFGYFRIVVPALRDRRADIPGLIEQCVARRAPEFGYSHPPVVSPDLIAILQAAAWPTNIRGLDSAIQYLLVNAGGAPELQLSHCVGALRVIVEGAHVPQDGQPITRTVELVAELGSISAAAKALGVPRSTVQRRLKRSSPASAAPFVDEDYSVDKARLKPTDQL